MQAYNEKLVGNISSHAQYNIEEAVEEGKQVAALLEGEGLQGEAERLQSVIETLSRMRVGGYLVELRAKGASPPRV